MAFCVVIFNALCFINPYYKLRMRKSGPGKFDA